MWLNGTGRIKYDPPRDGMKPKKTRRVVIKGIFLKNPGTNVTIISSGNNITAPVIHWVPSHIVVDLTKDQVRLLSGQPDIEINLGRIIKCKIPDLRGDDGQGWCIMETDREITRYYRYWMDKHRNPLAFKELNIKPPSWDAHVSIVRGERIPVDRLHIWKKYDGKVFDYQYCISPYRKDTIDNGVFWGIDVKCPIAKTIRTELGLPSDWDFHMTIGRLY